MVTWADTATEMLIRLGRRWMILLLNGWLENLLPKSAPAELCTYVTGRVQESSCLQGTEWPPWVLQRTEPLLSSPAAASPCPTRSFICWFCLRGRQREWKCTSWTLLTQHLCWLGAFPSFLPFPQQSCYLVAEREKVKWNISRTANFLFFYIVPISKDQL